MIEIPPPKKELQAFLGVINYLNNVSPSTADICKGLKQLTSVKTEWTWNAGYQKLFDKAKSIIRADECKKFFDETKPLYLEMGTSGGGLGASLHSLEKFYHYCFARGVSIITDHKPLEAIFKKDVTTLF